MSEYLYHYTTPEGLIGIVKTHRIRATNILYLNDTEEYRHGVKLGAAYVEELLGKAKDPDETAYLTDLKRAVQEMKDSYEAPGYVSSFSEKEDDLSQWRAYCSAGGFAIGFRKDLLKELAYKQLYAFERCSYDPSLQDRLIRGYIDHGIKADVSECGGYKKCRWAAIRLMNISAALKHQTFHQEEEWRMVRYPGPDAEKKGLDFRFKNGVVVPYMECDLEFKDDMARTKTMWESVRVTVGPTPTREVSKASVEKLLRLRSPAGGPGTVTLTSVPYKYW
ncbi:MAG: DUF2971 domain-containing protein [Planctomycetes bacterium]|nr:DUF2971 domain-containing protein [Planctomycetota bacterium]